MRPPRLEGLRPDALSVLGGAAGVLLVIHYAWILDDAYVYFRYVDNWVLLGEGLVYNRGEYVEGFTSPLWVLLLSAARLAGLDFWLIVRAVGALAFAGFWWQLILVDRRLGSATRGVPNVPLLYLSLNYGVLCYFTSGTESPLVLLLAPTFALFVLAPKRRWAQLGVALAPLVRPELALASAAAALWLLARERRFPWRIALLGGVSCGGWLLFRVLYYADLAPTTFHLKNATEFAQGLRYLWDAFVPYQLPPLLLLGAALLAALRRRGAPIQLSERLAMLGIASLVAFWVVRIGGDARHFRYLAFSFSLACCSLGGIAPRLPSLHSSSTLRVATGLAIAVLSFVLPPRQLDTLPILGLTRATAVDEIRDAGHHRAHPQLPRLDPWALTDGLNQRERYLAARAVLSAGDYAGIERGYICWKHYRSPERRSVHSLGLTEPILARIEMDFDRPGHKWDLIGPSRDLAAIQTWWGRAPEPGMYRAAVQAGIAPAWVAANLDAIEVIERKIYNRHRLGENLPLALLRPRITLPETASRAPRGVPPEPAE